MAVEIGALRALLSLDSAAFETGVKRAQASMGKLQKSLTQASTRMRDTGRKLTTRLSAPMAALGGIAIKTSLSTVDAQAKLAQSLGTSTRSMQVLARSADLAGISTGELEQIGRQLTKRLSQAATGTGPAIKQLDRLGLSASDLAEMDLDQKISVINRAIKDTIPEAEQAAVAMALFGDRAGIMAGRLDADTIARANEELERFGVTVTEIEADQIEATNDAISALGLVTKGLANQITVALAPTLQRIAETLADWGARFNALDPEMKSFIAKGALLAAAVGPLAIGLGFVAAGLAAVLSPIGAVVFGLGAAAGAVTYLATQWDELTKKYPALQKLSDLGKRLAEVWADLPAIKWAALIPVLRWARFIPRLRWLAYIPKISWAVTAGALKWSLLIGKLSWAALRVIPGIGWAALAGSLAWSLLVKKIEWSGWIPKIVWADWIPAIDWDRIFGGETSGSLARRVGRQIGSGLAQGIDEGTPSVGSAARRAARGAIDEAESELGVKSPSRVFMEIGRHMMSGLGLGIQANTQIATDAIREGVAGMSKSLDGLGQKSAQVADRFAGMVAGIIEGTQSIGDVLKQLGSSLLNTGLSGLFSASGIGDIFSGLFPGFEGGGFTGLGARSGGLDGRGGFPAILHPNETVIDHTRGMRVTQGRAQAMNVTITMDESTGSIGAFVRDQAGRVVAQAAPKIVSQSVGATYKRAREVPIGRR